MAATEAPLTRLQRILERQKQIEQKLLAKEQRERTHSQTKTNNPQQTNNEQPKAAFMWIKTTEGSWSVPRELMEPVYNTEPSRERNFYESTISLSFLPQQIFNSICLQEAFSRRLDFQHACTLLRSLVNQFYHTSGTTIQNDLDFLLTDNLEKIFKKDLVYHREELAVVELLLVEALRVVQQGSLYYVPKLKHLSPQPLIYRSDVLDKLQSNLALTLQIKHDRFGTTNMEPWTQGLLPAEIMLRIFGYLTVDDLCRCSLVNKEWHSLSLEDVLYKELLWQLEGENERETVGGRSYRDEYLDIIKKRRGRLFIDGVLKCLRCYRLVWACSLRKRPRLKYGCLGCDMSPQIHTFCSLPAANVVPHLVKGYTFLPC
eukprot:TRINITY_DN15543_c0_g1_i1.p1 TRINITY_DN15543_c0_g1~~TRINITY_DN15543_c0_g1_i1.p1  ORF type:complete len:373 (-),score=58.20 TRINITY_DN15543_c0_g1_i1:90-1208(-)